MTAQIIADFSPFPPPRPRSAAANTCSPSVGHWCGILVTRNVSSADPLTKQPDSLSNANAVIANECAFFIVSLIISVLESRIIILLSLVATANNSPFLLTQNDVIGDRDTILDPIFVHFLVSHFTIYAFLRVLALSTVYIISTSAPILSFALPNFTALKFAGAPESDSSLPPRLFPLIV
ncbi:hypothetical protein AX774_g1313 [Zancudomyces culisetae]|uniref:Uncharacterized protein n=1 Tax=Zancudomyces culisetae TaxID=1213189 RepID=A0A1R1PW02_ZANCU|nr:hypothetical protein AX774_g1313 [Zancudomyces culisetae]|eukprot:OMH85147.1 hypothetical protein AX774_g1313 [Zancudomyces culisetae]